MLNPLKALIKVSKVSWTSQLSYELLRSSFERKFDKTNFVSPKKTPPKSPQFLGLNHVLTFYCTHNHSLRSMFRVLVVFWPCQWNLIKAFQTEANTSLITKMALKFFLNILVEVIRPSKLQNSDIQSHFSMSKIIRIFLKKNFIGEYQFRSPTFVKTIFW